MAHYRQVGRRPAASGTPSTGRPDGGLYYEELMGEEGFSSDSSLLYHRGVPSAIVDARPWELPDQATDAERAAAAAAPEAARPVPRRGVEGRRRGHRPAAGAGQRRRADLLRRRAARPRRSTATPSATSASTSRRRRRRWRRCSARWTVGAGRLRDPPAGHHPPLGARPATEPLRAYAIEANSHIAPPKRYLSRYGQLLEHAPYCERDLRGPAEPLLVRGHRRRGATSSTAAPGPAGWPAPSTSCPSTRSTSSAGTAASTRTRSTSPTSSRSPAGCTSRRRCTRSSRGTTSWSATSCRARSTTTRSRCRCPTTTPTSTPTRSCSTSAATTRPARAPASARARSRCTPAGTPTARSPARSSARLGAEYFDELAVMVDTFRPLELGEAGTATRRRQVRLVLVGPGAVGMTARSFDGLFDDAALFPPGNAAMADAVPAHLAWRRSPYGAWSGRSSARRPGSASCSSTCRRSTRRRSPVAGAEALQVSLIAADAEALPAAGRAALAEPRVELRSRRAARSRGPADERGRRRARTCAGGVAAFVELPWDEVGRRAARRLAGSRYRAKLRTGGLRRRRSPTAASSAGRIAAAPCAASVPFKCTAGLHHAVRHTDPAHRLRAPRLPQRAAAGRPAPARRRQRRWPRCWPSSDADPLPSLVARPRPAAARARSGAASPRSAPAASSSRSTTCVALGLLAVGGTP